MITLRSASEQAALLRAGAVSACELLDEHLATIARRNPVLNAICTLDEDAARVTARRADQVAARGEWLGPLHGLPVGIKDVTPTAGLRTTYGSPLFRDHVPRQDAEIVRRLRAAGAVILGKTNTPEFATGGHTFNEVFGVSRNPWNPALSPGGSTGGGAAAVAAGMIALAEGTDFGGSMRTPAAFCGVVGLRPTPGLVPAWPAQDPWDTGQVHGAMARTAEDVALMLDAVAGPLVASPISLVAPWSSALADLPQGLRVAFAPDIAGIGVDHAIARVCAQAADALRQSGLSVTEIAFDLSAGRAAYLALRAEWMLVRHAALVDCRAELGANLRGNIEAGLTMKVSELAAAKTTRAQLWQRWCELFETADLLITPTAPVLPFPVEQNAPSHINGRKLDSYIDWLAPTFLVTMAGLPAVSVPCGLTPDGLPVGLQIVGRRLSEPLLLAVAALVQRLLPIGHPPA
jgi:amidase